MSISLTPVEPVVAQQPERRPHALAGRHLQAGLEIAVHLLPHRTENTRRILKGLSGIGGGSFVAHDGENAVLHLEGVIDIGLQLAIDRGLAPLVALDPLGGINLRAVEFILERQLPARLVPRRRLGRGVSEEHTQERDRQ
jgi:hypothetical protein